MDEEALEILAYSVSTHAMRTADLANIMRANNLLAFAHELDREAQHEERMSRMIREHAAKIRGAA